MSKHTPGPWRLTEQPTPNDFGKQIVGQETREGVSKVHGVHVCNVFVQEGRESEANARLIAAAPEMLAALRAIIDDSVSANGTMLSLKAHQIIMAAIAKAEGSDE